MFAPLKTLFTNKLNKLNVFLLYPLFHTTSKKSKKFFFLMISLQEAIDNLENPNDSIRLQSILICSNFQTPDFFDFSAFQQLSDIQAKLKYRFFAYKSLTIIIKYHFFSLGVDLQKTLMNNFPFFDINTISFDEPVFSIIIDCASTYLTYVADIDFILDFILHFQNDKAFLFAQITAEFIESFNTSQLSKVRKKMFNKDFVLKIVEAVQNLIIEPMKNFHVESFEFSFFFNLISKIFNSSVDIAREILLNKENECFFANFSPMLWDCNDNNYICNFFNSIFEIDVLFPVIVHKLIESSNTLINNYSVLFLTELQNNINNYSQFLFAFHQRLPIFFHILNYINTDSTFMLEIVSQLLHSNSPSIITETMSMTTIFLQHFNNSLDFQQLFFQQRLSLFEDCITLISFDPKDLPGAKLDELWSHQNFRTKLFSLVKALSFFDFEIITTKMIEFILKQTKETPLLNGFIRILSSILGPPLDISRESKHLSFFLINILSNLSCKLQNHVCILLSKLLNYITFENDEMNEYFNNLLEIFITKGSSAFDLLNTYFLNFYEKYSKFGIKLPVERLQSIMPNNPCYFTISNILTQFNGNDFSLSNAIEELKWFVSSFNFQNFEDQMHLNKSISKAFVFLSNYETTDENTIKLIIILLIQSSNTFMNVSNTIDDEGQGSKLITPIRNLSLSICKFANLMPNFLISHLSDIIFPNVLLNLTFNWCNELIYPLIQILYQYSPNDITNFSLKLSQHFITIIITSADNELKELQSIPKKIIIFICKLCVIFDDNYLTETLHLFLQFNDFRIYSAVVKAIFSKGMNILPQLWDDLIQRKDIPSIDFLTEQLKQAYSQSNNDITIFSVLPGIKEEQLSYIQARINNCSTDKGLKRCFKLLINCNQ